MKLCIATIGSVDDGQPNSCNLANPGREFNLWVVCKWNDDYARSGTLRIFGIRVGNETQTDLRVARPSLSSARFAFDAFMHNDLDLVNMNITL